MRVGVLTSSRADFGIYLPLLLKLKKDKRFKLKLIVFGSHLSKRHGYTLNEIESNGIKPYAKIKSTPKGDSVFDISNSIGKTTSQFAKFWSKNGNEFDLVLCLGDRYEMFAAVTAGVPFGIKFAHFHGGETSLGAIDESFRHSITAMSSIHFTATKKAQQRVIAIKGDKKDVYNVGALGLDNLNEVKLLSKNEFYKKFGVLPDNPILVTFHPETVNYNANKKYANILCAVLKDIRKQVFITLPNADTNGEVIRKAFLELAKKKKNIHCFNSLGTLGYFSAMSFSSVILGNSSSGIIEAASLKKMVINIGDRQKGRERSMNVIDCAITKNDVVKNLRKFSNPLMFYKSNIYGAGNTSSKVISLLLKMNIR
jgi:GDP/UDP-N,N'-diacetylbacillosamine 2-epimerase (hydrolysing)